MDNIDDAQQFIADMIHTAGRLTMQRNIAIDPTKPKWARVCGSARPCAFCVMLASRGFAYNSQETADFGPGFHDGHCHCTIVPSWGKDEHLLAKQAQWKSMYDTAEQASMHAREKTTPANICAWLRYNFPGLLKDGVAFDPDMHIPKDSKIERQLGLLNTMRINQMLKNTPYKDAARLWASHASDYLVRNPHHKVGAYFDRNDGGISLEVKELGLGDDVHRPYEVWFHESGHMLDWLLNGRQSLYYSETPCNGEFLADRLISDANNLYAATAKQLANDGKPTVRANVLDAIAEEIQNTTEQTDRNIEDMLQAALGDDYPRSVGHPDGYYPKGRYHSYHRQCTEAFAEMLDAQLSNPQAWSLIEKYFPESAKLCEDMVKEATP